MKSIYIYGASGHGLVVADIATSCGYDTVILIDDGDNRYPTFNDIKRTSHIPIAFGIGNNDVRAKLFEKVLENGFEVVTLIHPSSVVSQSSILGLGTVVMPNVVINAQVIVKDCVILNSSCVVEHQCYINKFTHISPNVALAGDVTVGEFTHIGIGSNIIQGVNIGNNCIIGAGSTIVNNIESNIKAYGNPCRNIGEI